MRTPAYQASLESPARGDLSGVLGATAEMRGRGRPVGDHLAWAVASLASKDGRRVPRRFLTPAASAMAPSHYLSVLWSRLDGIIKSTFGIARRGTCGYRIGRSCQRRDSVESSPGKYSRTVGRHHSSVAGLFAEVTCPLLFKEKRK